MDTRLFYLIQYTVQLIIFGGVQWCVVRLQKFSDTISAAGKHECLPLRDGVVRVREVEGVALRRLQARWMPHHVAHITTDQSAFLRAVFFLANVILTLMVQALEHLMGHLEHTIGGGAMWCRLSVLALLHAAQSRLRRKDITHSLRQGHRQSNCSSSSGRGRWHRTDGAPALLFRGLSAGWRSGYWVRQAQITWGVPLGEALLGHFAPPRWTQEDFTDLDFTDFGTCSASWVASLPFRSTTCGECKRW